MGQVEQEIKRMWVQASTGLYGSVEEAEAGFERVNALVKQQAAKERAERRDAAAVARADREARAYRGASSVAPTCGRCGSQHPGEC